MKFTPVRLVEWTDTVDNAFIIRKTRTATKAARSGVNMSLHARPRTPPPPTDTESISSTSPPPDWIEALAASVGLSVAVGAIAGFMIGGIGGRVAMRILVLTSDDNVRGLTSDDGFEIGIVSFATIFLLILTTVAGGMAGGGFGLIRMFVPGPLWLVVPGFGLATAAFGGAMLVQSEGIDFRVLEPLWLAVGLFVVIPGLWGVTMVLVVERLAKGTGRLHPPPLISQPRWGAVGWTMLAALTAIGVVDLLNDITVLRT